MTATVAVIGSGMAGLAAAHGCHRAGWQVTLFEARPGRGMDAHSIGVDGGVVDAPLRVMGEQSWRQTLALAREVGVDTFAVEVATSCSWPDRKTWFRSGRMPLTGWPVVGSWRYVNARSLRLARGLVRLARLTSRVRSSRSQQTLGQLLREAPQDRLFWRGLVLPILATICTCDEEHLLAWPAPQLLSLFHGIIHEERLLRLRGGTSALASALAGDIPCHEGSPVTRVGATDHGLMVENARGQGGCFDRVIVATPANQLDFLDLEIFGRERRVLQGIGHARGELVVHRDKRFMPRAERDWTALNFQMDRKLQQSMFTVWVNAVEPSMNGMSPVFQTWNPMFEPDDAAVIDRLPMQRALVHAGTESIHRQLRQWHAEPGRRLFYCGAWAYPGVPLLESAVRSARVVVEGLGQPD